MPANRFLPDEWESRLEEIDLAILHISEVLSPEIAQVIASRVREHLSRRSGTAPGGMTS